MLDKEYSTDFGKVQRGKEGFEPRFCAKEVRGRRCLHAKPLLSLRDSGGLEYQCRKKEQGTPMVSLVLLARPEGFEPPAFGIGIHCDIQLRHGRV